MSFVERLSRRLYPEERQRNPVAAFLERLHEHVRPEDEVLELGAGAGLRSTHQLRGRCRRVVGVDLDPRVLQNPLLDVGVVGDACRTGLPDASFDVVFSIWLLEHVAAPADFCREVSRLLKPGGVFLSLTPNRWHYVPLIASLTPTRFHKWVNARRGRAEGDTFPTTYCLNTRSQLRQQFAAVGMRDVLMDLREFRPNYLAFSAATFSLGAVYERVVNAVKWLAPLRVSIICVFSKPLSHAERRVAGS